VQQPSEPYPPAILSDRRDLANQGCRHASPSAKLMRRAEFEQHVGAENIYLNVAAALARAELMFRDMPTAMQSLNLHRRKTDFVPDAAAAKA
jgi:hypothetical protein